MIAKEISSRTKLKMNVSVCYKSEQKEGFV